MSLGELLRKYRDWVGKFLLRLHKRDLERGGWLYRYGTPAAVLSFIYFVVFYVMMMLEFKPILPQYLPHFGFTYIYIQLALGMVIVVGFLRMAKKWWIYLFVIDIAVTLAAIATITILVLT